MTLCKLQVHTLLSVYNVFIFNDDRGVRASLRTPQLVPRNTLPPLTNNSYQVTNSIHLG